MRTHLCRPGDVAAGRVAGDGRPRGKVVLKGLDVALEKEQSIVPAAAARQWAQPSAQQQQIGALGGRAVLNGKTKKVFLNRLAAVGGWRLVAVGGWRLAVGGGWRLAVGGPLGRSLRAVLKGDP